MDLLAEWKRLLNGKSEADKSEFGGLIPHDATDDWLRDAFGTLPNGHIMIQRLKILLQENASNGAYIVPKRENYVSQDEIQKLATEYRDNVFNYLCKYGRADVADEIKGSKFMFVYDNREFLSLAGDYTLGLSEAEDEIENDFADKFQRVGDWMYALDEAVLFLTKYPNITRFILEEVVCLDFDSRPYYELWRGGGDVCFMKGRILLLCEAGPS